MNSDSFFDKFTLELYLSLNLIFYLFKSKNLNNFNCI